MSVRRNRPHTVRFHVRRLVVESGALGSGPQVEAALRSALAQAFSDSTGPSTPREACPMAVSQVANAVSIATWSHPSVADVAPRPAARTTSR
jgi:hypothetical protein